MMVKGVGCLRRWRWALMMALVPFVFSCRNVLLLDAAGFAPVEVVALPEVMPSDSTDLIYQGLSRLDLVMKFYGESGGTPVWTNRVADIDSLLSFIQNIRYYGLLPQHYHFNEILSIHILLKKSPDERLRLDVLLTDAFFSLGTHLRSGRLNPPPRHRDSLQLLLIRETLTGGGIRSVMEGQEPLYAGYHSLKMGLRQLLHSVDSGVRLSLLRGLTPDSTGQSDSIRLVEINLERWRWEQEPFGDRFIFVNIPSFMVELIQDNKLQLFSRAIVGKPQNPTPVFSSAVQCVTTYPYWHVPRKISVQEFLPRIQRDSTFLRRNNFDVLGRNGKVLNPDSLDWRRFNSNYFPVVLRQREGEENSMGIVKFMFDNPYAVFLHDTNAPRLFKNKTRALSHGCVRVEKAVELAHLLITGEKGKKDLLLEKYLNEKQRHNVDLTQSVPVHLRYFTADFKDEKLVLYKDIYRKDAMLINNFYPRADSFY